MSAHEWIMNVRRTLAHWLYVPFSVTAWEPERATTALLPAPAQQQVQEEDDLFFELPNLLEGIIGGPEWHGAPGSLLAARRHKPLKRRDTGVLVLLAQHPPLPVQNTGSIQRLSLSRSTPIPDVPEVPEWANQEAQEKRISDALAIVDRARMSLQPLTSDEPAAGDRLAYGAIESSGLPKMPSREMWNWKVVEISKQSAFDEFTALASQPADDKTAKVPAYMQQRAKQLLQQLKESE